MRKPLHAGQRSRVTNGKSLFVEGVDSRGIWARRLRDLIDLHLSDLGGADAISEAERSIVRRASVLECELERMEARFAAEPADMTSLDCYQRGSNTLRRLLEAVGLERRQKDVTPSLAQYLASRATEQPADSIEASGAPADSSITERASESASGSGEAGK